MTSPNDHAICIIDNRYALEIPMGMNRKIATLVASAAVLMATPAMAQSVRPSNSLISPAKASNLGVVRRGAPAREANDLAGGAALIVALLGGAALILGIVVVADQDDDAESP